MKKYISGILWVSKSKLQLLLAATYVVLFLSDSSNYIFSIYVFLIYLLLYFHVCLYHFFFGFFFCFYFHLLFLTLVVTRHIVQFTMFDLIHCSPPFLYLSNIQNHYVKTLLRQKTEYHFVFCFCFKIHTKKDFLLQYANNFICS